MSDPRKGSAEELREPCAVCGGTLEKPCKHILGSPHRLARLLSKAYAASREQAPEPTRRLMHCPGDSPSVTHYEDTDCAEAGCVPVGEQGREQATATPQVTRFAEFDDIGHPFQVWWERHGQFMLSGGGRRESIWAARGWIAREQMACGVEVTGDSLHEERGQAGVPSPAATSEREWCDVCGMHHTDNWSDCRLIQLIRGPLCISIRNEDKTCNTQKTD
jgi:hypothetical protein